MAQYADIITAEISPIDWAQAYQIQLIGTQQDSMDIYYDGFDPTKVVEVSQVPGFSDAMEALMLLPDYVSVAMEPQYNQYTKRTDIKAIYFSTKYGSGYMMIMPYGYIDSIWAGGQPGFVLEQPITGNLALHEFGHVVDFFGVRIMYYWEPILGWSELSAEANRIFDAQGMLWTSYANTNPAEDFAVHFRAYVSSGEPFRSALSNPDLAERYSFLKNYIFQGVEYGLTTPPEGEMVLYADIIAVIAPTAADAGEAVPVKAYIKNLYTATVSIKATATVFVDTTAYDFITFPGADLAPGYTAEFLGGFTMPNSNVRVHVVSYWYGSDGNWHIDDTMDIDIALTGVLPTSDIRNFDFKAQAGTYNLGSSVPYDAPYEYKGKAQVGYLTISLGTGVYPSFFTKYTFPRQGLSFNEAMDWTPGQLSGAFVLPATLELGQTYSVRAKLETADGKQETDTDWGVIKIAELVPGFTEFAISSFSKL